MNDERDPRDPAETPQDEEWRRWEAERADQAPPETEPSDAATGAEDETPAPAPAEPAAEAEEETTPAEPSWPSADRPAPEAEAWSSPPAVEPEEASAPAGEAAGPPPSEVEAYPAAAPAAPPEEAPTAAHPVPATEVGESTQCPRCGTENRPGLAFCRSCGQRLVAAGVAATVERPSAAEGTQACPRCGTHNRAGTAFCQNCGANLRAATTPGYVPPAAAELEATPAGAAVEAAGRAFLGPVVLLIGAIGLVTGYLLPFPYGDSSLYDRAFATGGYGFSFWNGYPDVSGGLADNVYFGLAAASPLLVLLLVVLAATGIVRARPGTVQLIGLVIALVWGVGLAALFAVVEIGGGLGGDLADLLRSLSAGGIIFFLAGLVILIGTLTRLARS